MTVQAYIELQPQERQAGLNQLRQVILSSLPTGFEEVIQYNMITFVVPHSLYPKGYHCNPKDPLPFLSLANQKGFIALYHMAMYMDDALKTWFEEAYAALDIGKLDMGKSCVRFKKMEKIPYSLIAELCGKITPEAYVEVYEKTINRQ